MPKTQRRRRKEGKTDYKARLTLLKSGELRLVIRKTNRYIIAQIVQSHGAQDAVVASVNSRDLLEKGWPKEKTGSLKSLHAAYLTGFMLGKHAKTKSKDIILDAGLQRNVKQSRIYAALKGAIDAGLNVAHSESALPTKERMDANKELAHLIERLKEKL